MRLAAWLLVVLCLCQTAITSESTVVGDLGAPERLMIQGTTAFSPAKIREKLAALPGFQAASETDAPLDDYLKVVGQYVRAAYCNAGFPDVEVSVRPDAQKHVVAVNVKEGLRYLSGDVRIRGNKTISAPKLVERLTQPYPPKDAVARWYTGANGETVLSWTDQDGKAVKAHDPVWRIGKPAPFLVVPEPDSDLHRDVAEALADLGYPHARFAVDVVADPASHKGHLVVDLSGEGKQTVFSGAEITGTRTIPDAEILKYIGFQPGSPAIRDELVRFQSKLWHSGRFIRPDVAAAPSADGKSHLRINVLELLGATRLSQPLSREESLLLKCRDSLTRTEHWNGDLTFDYRLKEGQVAIVFSPNDGVFLQIKYVGSPSQQPCEYAAIFSRDEIGMYCLSGARKLVGRPPRERVVIDVGMQWKRDGKDAEPSTLVISGLNDSGDTSEKDKKSSDAAADSDNKSGNSSASDKLTPVQSGRLTFQELRPAALPKSQVAIGWHVNSDVSSSTLPLSVRTTFDPACFLDLARYIDGECTFKEGVCTIPLSGGAIHLDTVSGQLRDLVTSDGDEQDPKSAPNKGKESSSASAAAPSGTSLRMAMVPGEFRRRVDAIHTATAKVPNGYDSRRPLTSLLRFTCAEDLLWQVAGIPEDRRPIHAIHQILDKDVLEPLDRLVCTYLADGQDDAATNEDDFVVPEPLATSRATYHSTSLWLVFSYFFSPDVLMEEILRPGSWPVELWKMVGDRAVPSATKWKKIYDSNAYGPVAFFFAGEVLKSDNPVMADLLASRGLARLSVEDFRKDYRVLLDPQYPPGQLAHRMAMALRDLDERDLELLGALLPSEHASLLKAWASDQRKAQQHSIDDALAKLLETVWQAGLRNRMKLQLELLQGYSTFGRLSMIGNVSDLNKVIDNATQSLRVDPKCVRIYQLRARAYALQYNADKAIADYGEVIKLEPTASEAYVARGLIYLEKGNAPQAEADLAEAKRLRNGKK